MATSGQAFRGLQSVADSWGPRFESGQGYHNPEVIQMMRSISEQEIRALSKRFASAKPFPHVVIENFLDGNNVDKSRQAPAYGWDNHKRLLSELKRENFTKKDSDLFTFKQTNNLFYSKNPVVAAAVTMFSSKQFAGVVSSISGIRLKSGAVDVSGALYEKTDYLLCHDDKLEGRKIAYIAYLSDLKPIDGGSLRMFNIKAPLQPAKKITPRFNSFACFKVSGESLHDIEEAKSNKKRLTVGGWFNGD